VGTLAQMKQLHPVFQEDIEVIEQLIDDNRKITEVTQMPR